MQAEFHTHSDLGAVKSTLEKSFQNFVTGVIDGVDGFTMGGKPRVMYDFSPCFPKIDKKVFCKCLSSFIFVIFIFCSSSQLGSRRSTGIFGNFFPSFQ